MCRVSAVNHPLQPPAPQLPFFCRQASRACPETDRNAVQPVRYSAIHRLHPRLRTGIGQASRMPQPSVSVIFRLVSKPCLNTCCAFRKTGLLPSATSHRLPTNCKPCSNSNAKYCKPPTPPCMDDIQHWFETRLLGLPQQRWLDYCTRGDAKKLSIRGLIGNLMASVCRHNWEPLGDCPLHPLPELPPAWWLATSDGGRCRTLHGSTGCGRAGRVKPPA